MEPKKRGKREPKSIANTLRVNLNADLAVKFEALKKHYAIETDSEMVRVLIQRVWREEIERDSKK